MALTECHVPMGRQEVQLKESHPQETPTQTQFVRSSHMGRHVFWFGWIRYSILAKENHLDLGQIT